jgi:hypothetical protein
MSHDIEQATRRAGPAMQVTYTKLIRDPIPEVIQADGRRAVTRVLDSRGYQAALVASSPKKPAKPRYCREPGTAEPADKELPTP